MKDVAYLVYNKSGIVRMAKRMPSLRSGEHALKVSLEVPATHFVKAFPELNIALPPPDANSGIRATVDGIDAYQAVFGSVKSSGS